MSKLDNTGKVIFGVTVTLVNLDTEETVTYQLVGEDEADIRSGKISVGSPIARALVGKMVGDSVRVQVPSGMVEFEIDNVQHL